MDEQAKTAVDAFAISGTVGALAGWLPPAAALLTLIWTLIRIWETDTVKGLINGEPGRRAAKPGANQTTAKEEGNDE